jgi:hypothetical protein
VAGLLGSIGAVAMSAITLADRASAADLGGAVRTGLRRTPDVLLFMLVTGAVVTGLALTALLGMWLAVSLLTGGPVSRGGPGVFAALVIGVSLVVVLATLSVRWAVAFPVLTVEPSGWRGALARSWQLSAGHVWRIFVIVLAGGLITLVLAAFISQIAALLLVDAVATPLGLDPDLAETLALALGTVVLAPLSPVLLAATYGQLRWRQEKGRVIEPE